MLIVFFRAVILYALVTLCLRLMGKRQIGELQPSELVTTILISNIAALPIEDADVPIILGVIPVFVLAASELIVSTLSLKYKRFRTVLSGKPVTVIEQGIIDQEKLRMIRFSIDDLLESLRQQGVFKVQDVWYAVVETSGKVSVLQRSAVQPITPETVGLSPPEEEYPTPVISDGRLIEEALPLCKMTKEQVERAVRKKGLSVNQVFLMTADKTGEIYIVKKQKGRMR